MSRGGMIMMVLVLTLVWGGFGAALVVAMIHERKKDDAAGRVDAGGETAVAEPGAGNGGGE